MPLGILQQRLQQWYDLDIDLKVEEFTVSDPAFLTRMGGAPSVTESVYLVEDCDELSLSLYLDPEVMGSLEADNPLLRLHEGNLHPFSLVVEGVSHFLLLCWRALYGRSVSALELELQAEVDKFVLSYAFLKEQCSPVDGDALWNSLFARYRFRADVSVEEVDRYRFANEWAARYCAQLWSSFLHPPARQLLPELRRFYRMDQRDKVHRIRGLARL